MADVLSILYAFYFPRRWFVLLLVIGSAFSSYFPFLFGKTPVAMPILNFVMGCALMIVAMDVVRPGYVLESVAEKTEKVRVLRDDDFDMEFPDQIRREKDA